MPLHPLNPLKTTIEVCRPLIGHWKGMYEDQPVEELWLEPISDEMMGCFRWVKEGRVWLHELMQFAEVDGGVVLRVKHFSHDFTGWEEKEQSTTFDVVEASDTSIVLRQRHNVAVIWAIYDWSEPETVRAWFERVDEPHHLKSVFAYTKANP